MAEHRLTPSDYLKETLKMGLGIKLLKRLLQWEQRKKMKKLLNLLVKFRGRKNSLAVFPKARGVTLHLRACEKKKKKNHSNRKKVM